jgi:acyl carrier protein
MCDQSKGEIIMVFEKVKELIAEQLDVDASQITMDTDFMKDLEADSLDAVEIILGVEDEYGIEIPDEAAENFTKVGDIVDYIEANK